jgi:SpoVK/Ycf46/Vps4 family AAA+-type ATPase
VDLARIAKTTEGCSGADLAMLCEQATESALSDSIRTGAVRNITQQDLERAAAAIRPSIGGWLETAKNYATYADESGDYDELLAYLRRRRS